MMQSVYSTKCLTTSHYSVGTSQLPSLQSGFIHFISEAFHFLNTQREELHVLTMVKERTHFSPSET